MREILLFDTKRNLFAIKWMDIIDNEVIIKLKMTDSNIKIYKVSNADSFHRDFYKALDENDARNLFYEINAANQFHSDTLVKMVSVNLN